MPRRILTVDLHPGSLSLSAGLAQAYQEGAKASGHQLRGAALSKMQFNPDFGQSGFRNSPALEDDLLQFREDLLWAEHVVLFSPLWWGGLPAKAKGLIDRTFLPGYAFDPRVRKMGLPKPLLAGRSARLVLTADTPGWGFRFLYRSALRHQMQRQILGYTGISPMAFTLCAPVEQSTDAIRARWLAGVRALGQAGA
ncbi:NAD(P)H-dependent oxidoreductase [Tabrizicola sp.]|uniref:NAD(P)H-dependent oxidoreductase n=1 Tax=Tabrizicola sp. TaxID=2005166 RepID=UPI00286CE551|nr:NAD(P)H-dependent oxidoreductase [Tabrizicola sp.]